MSWKLGDVNVLPANFETPIFFVTLVGKYKCEDLGNNWFYDFFSFDKFLPMFLKWK